MEGARNYNRWVVAAFEPFFGQSIVEIGIGHGGFYEHLPRPRTYIGTDLDASLVERARLRQPDLQFVQADIADPHLADRFAGTGVDTVLCVNVLEHVEDDRAAIRNMLDVLEPGGHLLLFVPAFRQLYTDLDRLAGHLRRYTRATVAHTFRGSSAEIRRLEYF